jgi:Tfp pilus assembly protein PilN
MIRRMDLLPAAYVQRQRDQRNLTYVFLVFGLILILLIAWFFVLSSKISSARSDLAEVQTRNAQLGTQIAALQKFADLDAEVKAKRTALTTVFAGDIDWPSLMTDIAMVIPGEVWLDSLQTSAGTTEGAAPVGTETNPIRLAQQPAVGRVLFTGHSLDMPGISKWLIRLSTTKEFRAVWLSNASAEETQTGTGTGVVTFESTLELGDRVLSHRFQGELE